jgi:hypothetical protein
MSAKDGPDRLIKSAFGVLGRLRKNLGSDYELRVDREEAVVIDALKQHGDHLAVHRIEQTTIDAFKLACWLGGSLLEAEKTDERKCTVIIDALIKTLREFLIVETEWWLLMPPTCMALLKSLLRQERGGNYKHGIWMNGLYMSFHCSIKSWKEGKAYKIPL